MKYSSGFIICCICTIPFLYSCEAERNKKIKKSTKGESKGEIKGEINIDEEVKNITKEYRRLDKLCNQIELSIQETDFNNRNNTHQREELRKKLKKMKLDVLNLKSDIKANMMDIKGINTNLIKSGLNATLIEDLDQRIIKLNVVLNGESK